MVSFAGEEYFVDNVKDGVVEALYNEGGRVGEVKVSQRCKEGWFVEEEDDRDNLVVIIIHFEEENGIISWERRSEKGEKGAIAGRRQGDLLGQQVHGVVAGIVFIEAAVAGGSNSEGGPAFLVVKEGAKGVENSGWQQGRERWHHLQ